jgi:hypothetical protein
MTSTPAPTVERRRATSCARPACANASAVGKAIDLDAWRVGRSLAGPMVRTSVEPESYTDKERDAMGKLIAERIFHAASVGATAVPLLHEEAANLADAVVELIEECRGKLR